MKKLAIAVTLTASVFALGACSSDNSDSDVVAETEAGNITKDAFYQELKDRHGEGVLQEMVTVKVLEDQYDVSDEQVDQQIQNTKDQLGDQFEMALKQQGFQDEEAYRKVVRISLLQQEAVAEDMDITEEEMQNEYDRMQTEIEAKHILVQDKETANEVKQKLDDGGDFASLAAEYSADSANADSGGELGYFSTGKMAPAFEEKAYSMEPGEISEPVQTRSGFHIIKVTDKRDKEEDIGSFEENKDTIRSSIINERMDPQQAQQKIKSLLDDANINVQAKGLEGLFEQQQQSGGNEGSGNSDGGSDSSNEDSGNNN